MKTEDTQPEIQSAIIKVHAERCPVCKGHGTVNYGKLVCKACNGKTYILVPNEFPPEPKENPQ